MAMKKKNKNKLLLVSMLAGSLVINALPTTVLAQNIGKFNESDRPSNEMYEPITKKITSKKSTFVSTPDTLEVDDNTLSMTAEDTIKIKAVFKGEVQEENLQWTLGGKDISEWKTWNKDTKTYTGERFITIENTQLEVNEENNTTTVTATLKAGLLYNTTNASSYRKNFPQMIDNYDLVLTNTQTEENFKSTMKLNVYDSYKPYDELKTEIDNIFANAKSNMYLSYESIGKSVEGRDQHMVVMAKDKKSIDKYLNEQVPMMLENPKQLQDMIKNNDNKVKDYKVVIMLNNVHSDEAPGVDAQLDALRQLTTQDVIEYKTLNENNEEIVVKLDVSDLLDDVIFVMSLVENPDGRYYNVRQNVNGFDINRDHGYQTQVETQNLVAQIAKWNPISFLDLHGFISGFLIEPCTPPHDPNYEYDLVAKNSTAQAKAIGNAGISNTKYDSYEIPLLDYEITGGWDDATASYTATYALHHGAMAHTIEVPELNQESNNAFVNGIFGAASFVLNDKDNLYTQQLEYYRRGVDGEDNRAIDQYLVNAQGEEIGRPRGENENFFPEYYVLPVDEELQKNASEVQNVVDYCIRNGIKVSMLEKDTKTNKVTYPKGSYVIDMHQAKRGLANLVLYDGIDASDFPDMYAEIVMNFPDVRGFDSYEVRQKNAFKGKIKEVSSAKRNGTKVDTKNDKYVIKNTNNDVIKAVNELLKSGKQVQVIAKDTKKFEQGEYIVSSNDLSKIASKYTLEITPLKEKVEAKKLETPKVYATGSYSKFILKDLGFTLVDNKAEANIIVDDSGSANKNDLKDGVDYLGIGRNAIVNVGQEVITDLAVERTGSYHEGLVKAEYFDDIATGGYDDEEYMYTAGGTWISNVGEGSKVIAKVSDVEDFYVCGWWPDNEKAQGKAMGITKELKGDKAGTTVTLYANTITNKAHPQGAYRLMANSIYNSIDSEIVVVK